MEERRFRAGGGSVRYLVGGSGPPLVLCHGFLGSAENFEAWFPELVKRRTVIVPDLPGFGLTSPLAGEHTAANLAQVVIALADHLELDGFDLGGLCLGASVACAVVRATEGRVQQLVLHTPLLAPSWVRRRFHVQVAVMTAPGVFALVSTLSRQRLVSDLYKRMLVEGVNVDADAALMNFENQRRALPRAAREWLRDGLRRDDRAVVSAHPGGTLMLAAADDKIADVNELRHMAGVTPLAHLAVLNDAGHGWTADYVRRQLVVVTAFLDGAPVPEVAVAS
jgi:pimeloyl-ACP methyl ester carboxylesterase